MIDIYLSNNPLGQGWNCVEDGPMYLGTGSLWRRVSRNRLWRPPTDMYETDDAIILRLEVAGMKEEDFSITLHERHLYICGSRSDAAERRAFHQMEIPFGQFALEVDLPAPVNPDRVEAFYRDGFLMINLTKSTTYTVQIVEDDNS